MPRTILGKGYFDAKTKPLLLKLAEQLIQAGVHPNNYGREQVLPVFEDVEQSFYKELIVSCQGVSYRFTFKSSIKISGIGGSWCREEGLSDLSVHVHRKEALVPARRFARAWEAKSRRLKTSRDATVAVVKEYA